MFGVALVLTVGSAVAAKRSWVSPPLAMLAPSTALTAPPGAAQLPGHPLGIVDPLVKRDVPAPLPTVEHVNDAFSVGRYTPPPGFERYYAGRPLTRVRTLRMKVTAYSPDERSCGIWADGVTASNSTVWCNAMQLVAADTSVLPFGTLISIDGYAGDTVVPVLDRGGKIKGHHIDVLFPTHEEARQWGVQMIDVAVWEYADE